MYAQVPELQGLWKYRKKQKKKCSSLAALQRATDGGDAGVLIEADPVKQDSADPLRGRNESIEMR